MSSLDHNTFDLSYGVHEMGPFFLSFYNLTELMVVTGKSPYQRRFISTINGLVDLEHKYTHENVYTNVTMGIPPQTTDNKSEAPNKDMVRTCHFYCIVSC